MSSASDREESMVAMGVFIHCISVAAPESFHLEPRALITLAM